MLTRFSKSSPLLLDTATGAVDLIDPVEGKVPLGIEAEVAGDKELGAVGGDVDRGLEQEGLVARHAPEIPLPAERVPTVAGVRHIPDTCASLWR